jgi:hypothetical protein
MSFMKRAPFPHVVPLLLLLSLAAAKPVFADDLTGMPHDDPKDLLPPPVQEAASSSFDTGFLPLPSWARGAVMPPLPQALKPMGRKVVVLTTPPAAAPEPLAPPRETAPPTVIVAKPTPVAPASPSTPALIAVSPFLEWIKANPQAAAEQARQQANTYTAGSDANPPAATTNGNAAPNTNGTAPGSSTAAAPYWLPPLIDSAPFGAGATGSSAAIYSTPQR